MNNRIDGVRPFSLRSGASALLAVLLAGCVAGPDYRAPEAAMPASYQGQAKLDGHNGRKESLPAPALDAWWNGFNDPALERIIQRVLAQNLDLDAAMARVAQARAAANQAGARQLPSGELNASVARQHQSLQSPLGLIASKAPRKPTPSISRHWRATRKTRRRCWRPSASWT